jgi:hypothetical protein
MSITLTGLFLVPLGVVAFLARPKWLYALTIFFVPFSATSLINSRTGDTGSGLQPATFLGGLLLLRVGMDAIFRMKIYFPRAIRKPLLLVFLFVVACGISLIMPLIIDGKILVMTHGALGSPVEPLFFKSSNITYWIATLFGLFFAGYVARQNLEAEEFQKTLRVYLASGIFISLWGIMQAILFVLHIPYPAAVFNNSASPYALGYDKSLESVAVPRVSSVALEPSVLALCLVGMLPIVIAAVMGRRRIFGKYMDWFTLLLLLLTLALTTSSTGYVSMGVLILAMAWTLYKYGRLNVLWMVGILIVAGAGVAAAVVIPPVRDLLQEVVFSKADSLSAIERGTIVLRDAEYFQQYPILGLGWGSAPAHDLVLGILANTGVIGLASFALFVGYILRKLGKDAALNYASRQPFRPSYVMFLSILATCSAYLVSGLPTGPTFWVLVGLGVAACGQVQPSPKPRKANRGLRRFLRLALQPSAQV